MHRKLTDEEAQAITAFAEQYGREWKQYLQAAWFCHAYKGKHMSGADTGVLRAIRNDLGCDWLRSYKLPKNCRTQRQEA
jgi:hypothetical protein